jgi:cathepsin A (carboxypeptidase C)
VESGVDKNYFYWMFESRAAPASDPLVMWLNGGPGCSSQLGLLTENGPCTVSEDGLSTINNPNSWNTNANVMWVDQPAHVGYSYGAPIADLDHNEEEIAEDMYHFLQEFFTENPQFLESEFYVFGESYGGHYAPAISARIFEGNQANVEGTVKINLKGVGVGNGLTDPLIQYGYYPQMAMNNTYDIKCVSEETYSHMVDRLPFCQKLIAACQGNTSLCMPADDYCNLAETTPYYRTGLNPYDIRKPCGDSDLCYDFSNLDIFLNLDSTREALHISEKVDKWVACNTAVDLAIAPYDWMKNFQSTIAPMVEGGVRVLIYAGDTDFICNWMGNKAWTMAIAWDGREEYHATGDHQWLYGADSALGGYARSAPSTSGLGGSLTFLQVLEAGHMVPMDQPEAALAMLNAFTSNTPFY